MANPGEFQTSSTIEGMVWPAVPGPLATRLMALLFQLEQSQWFGPDEVRRRQQQQLLNLVRHAYATSPLSRERLEAAGWRPGLPLTEDLWHAIPLLTRAVWQQRREELYCSSVPAGHGDVTTAMTSGSTGQPVLVKATGLALQIWDAFTLREHLWQRRDFGGKLVTIQYTTGPQADNPDGKDFESWGNPTMRVTSSGPSAMLSIRTTIDRQAAWLARQNPHYVLTYPSNMLALARYCAEQGVALPNLRQVRTFGEVVEPGLRTLCRRLWNVPVADKYSSQEVGAIAFQCPDHEEHLHVQEENVILEVLDEEGHPCGPGQVGRVVLTSLLNFATPVIRYEIGDYAELGPACPCGRGLRVLKRILGRRRNMFILPDGRQVWPTLVPDLEGSGLTEYPPMLQFQVIQRSRSALEMLLVMPRPLTPAEEDMVRTWLAQGLGHRFDVAFTYVDKIASSPTGKFEEFRSEVTAAELT